MITINKEIDSILNNVIESGESREIKRAIAVKMLKNGSPTHKIKSLLNVTDFFISYYKKVYAESGAEGLRLGYKGSESYLSNTDKAAIITYLKTQKTIDLQHLINYIKSNYNVTYKSKQSYYDLLSDAGLSYHKTKKVNPKKDPISVADKRTLIKKKVEAELVAITKGETVVLMQDEVHLCHGDVTGYAWGKRNTNLEVPIKNQRERQTYYGALNPITGQVHMLQQDAGNTDNTLDFLTKLPQWYPQAKHIWLLWDNATYHKSEAVKQYLAQVNAELPEHLWKITCIGFAPNAPEQNPIEDAWLQGKTFLRKNFAQWTDFKAVKQAFYDFYLNTRFHFNKFNWYGFN